MVPLFQGTDYNHSLIIMHKPGGQGATKQQMIHCSWQHANRKQLVKRKLRKRFRVFPVRGTLDLDVRLMRKHLIRWKLPGVLFALPDSYVDPEHKDYGGKLFVNGEIVQRPPERQRTVEPQPQKQQDRARSVQRRKNRL